MWKPTSLFRVWLSPTVPLTGIVQPLYSWAHIHRIHYIFKQQQFYKNYIRTKTFSFNEYPLVFVSPSGVPQMSFKSLPHDSLLNSYKQLPYSPLSSLSYELKFQVLRSFFTAHDFWTTSLTLILFSGVLVCEHPCWSGFPTYTLSLGVVLPC